MTARQPARIRPRPQERPAEEERAELHATAETVLDDVDDLLDEIDAVLEDQAVLTNFRQRSGQ